MNIFNISTVHDFYDTRIQAHLTSSENAFFIGFTKEVISKKVYKNLGKSTFLSRVLAIFQIIKLSKGFNNGDIVIFHDPELILAAGMVKFFNNKLKVVFDAHENILEDVKHKYWINPIIRWGAEKYFYLLIMNFIFQFLSVALVIASDKVWIDEKHVLRDAEHRQLILHGVNIVYKVAPFIPEEEVFTPTTSLTD